MIGTRRIGYKEKLRDNKEICEAWQLHCRPSTLQIPCQEARHVIPASLQDYDVDFCVLHTFIVQNFSGRWDVCCRT